MKTQDLQGHEDAGCYPSVSLFRHLGVFRPFPIIAAMSGLLGLCAAAHTVALWKPEGSISFKAETMDAFASYVQATDSRNNDELKRAEPLLWIDALPDSERERSYRSLKQGELQIEQRITRKDGHEIPCPGGMIHHWEGLIFIPGVKVTDVLEILQDYDRHAIYYAPDVTQSRLISRDGDTFHVFLRFRRQKVITVVLNTEHEVHYFRDTTRLAHSRSSATHIAEVENAGKPNEREKARESDGGFLWGMETWWRVEEKDGGVYVQNEVVSLTRDIPAGLGWLIGPFVTSIPKETLTFTLEATRKAVLSRKQRSQPIGS